MAGVLGSAGLGGSAKVLSPTTVGPRNMGGRWDLCTLSQAPITLLLLYDKRCFPPAASGSGEGLSSSFLFLRDLRNLSTKP